MKNMLALALLIALIAAWPLSPALSKEADVFSLLDTALSSGGSAPWTPDDLAALCAFLSENGVDASALLDLESAQGRAEVCEYVVELSLGMGFDDWPIEAQHRYDQLLIAHGLLDRCVHLLPDEGEISQEEAEAIARQRIADAYGTAPEPTSSMLHTSYYAAAPTGEAGMWRIIERHSSPAEPETNLVVTIAKHGSSIDCRAVPTLCTPLDEEFEALESERGAFFKWPLQEKRDYALSLPDKLWDMRLCDVEPRNGETLEAISSTGFCLPVEGAISQEEALQIAVDASGQAFGLPDGWADSAEFYYSFFASGADGFVWRVIPWAVSSCGDYTGGVVEIDAMTGSVLRVRKNGVHAADCIPYTERL